VLAAGRRSRRPSLLHALDDIVVVECGQFVVQEVSMAQSPLTLPVPAGAWVPWARTWRYGRSPHAPPRRTSAWTHDVLLGPTPKTSIIERRDHIPHRLLLRREHHQTLAIEGDTQDSVAALGARIMLGRLRALTGDRAAVRAAWLEAYAALQRLRHPWTAEVAQLLADLDDPGAQ
jgi:hypothetical protein